MPMANVFQTNAVGEGYEKGKKREEKLREGKKS
jgi:hypothetical protein